LLQANVGCVALEPEGPRALVGAADGALCLLDTAQEGRLLSTANLEAPIR
jgi:hypothetical protein